MEMRLPELERDQLELVLSKKEPAVCFFIFVVSKYLVTIFSVQIKGRGKTSIFEMSVV